MRVVLSRGYAYLYLPPGVYGLKLANGLHGVLGMLHAATADVAGLPGLIDALSSATLVGTIVASSSPQQAGDQPVTATYVDGLGATLLTWSGVFADESSEAAHLTVNLPDAEGRELCRVEWIGHSYSKSLYPFGYEYQTTWTLARRALTTYDPAGLVLGTQEDAWETSGTQTIRHTTEQRNSYDDVGRQVKTERRVDHGAWRTTGRTVYATFVGGRSVTQIDSAGNKSITLTDDAGRTVEERVEGVMG